MKHSKSDVECKTYSLPNLKFENQRLTSFSGLIVFQQLFGTLDLARRVASCFRHQVGGKIFSRAKIFLQLVIHILLGFRELRDSDFYRDDPLVQRVLGLRCLPDVATISRMLKEADPRTVAKLRHLLRDLTLQRLGQMGLGRITLDFDGSVQSTQRRAEGAAVGFNKRRKGPAATIHCSARWHRPARSWTFCTARATCTIPMVPAVSSSNAWSRFLQSWAPFRSKCGWTRPSSATK